MNNKYRTPKIDSQNVISFTCSDGSIEPLLNLLNQLKSLGQMGCTRTIEFEWDGDGSDRVNNISVNGMSLSAWENEWKRLNDIQKVFNESQKENNKN